MMYDVLDSFFRFLDIKHTKRTKINRKKERKENNIDIDIDIGYSVGVGKNN